ncbi:MAG: hypothetical protein EU532_08645 [Promethearchaeota archaeon]|nr:MAG: hypothetical protein EU532_08645 [Candidatus Lokiarchaeota archaeon]
MNDKIIFTSNFYDLLIDKILNRLTNFIQYNPDDLNRKVLKKVIEAAISDITNLSIDEIDRSFESLAKFRIYSEPKKGVHLKTNFYTIFIPDLSIESIDQNEAEKSYVKTFFARINTIIGDSDELKQLLNKDEVETLKKILNESHKDAEYATIYQIAKNKFPTQEELEKFIESLE